MCCLLAMWAIWNSGQGNQKEIWRRAGRACYISVSLSLFLFYSHTHTYASSGPADSIFSQVSFQISLRMHFRWKVSGMENPGMVCYWFEKMYLQHLFIMFSGLYNIFLSLGGVVSSTQYRFSVYPMTLKDKMPIVRKKLFVLSCHL